MDAVTYPSERVKDVLARHTVGVRLNVFQERESAKRFRAYWTPTFLYVDPDGRELHRWLGYAPPDEFAAQVLLGVGLSHFQNAQFDRALGCFSEILERHPGSDLAPEATYWRGVCTFKKTKDTTPIYSACKEIVAKYPNSPWAKKIGFVSKYKDFNLSGK